MSGFIRLRGLVGGVAVLSVISAVALADVTPFGREYRLTPPMSGDQVYPQVALGPEGGFLVWQDNRTDGQGTGISARWLDPNMIGAFGSFRVNETAEDDQELPQVGLFPDGGAIFVWQGGPMGQQDIMARILGANGLFLGGDIRVSGLQGAGKQSARVTVLEGGDAVVIWESFEQDGSLMGIYGQRLSSAGEKIGSEFRLNEETTNNQRNPAITSLPNGGFLAAWVTERVGSLSMYLPPSGVPYESGSGVFNHNIQIVCRAYDAQGVPVGAERAVSDPDRIAANPSLSASADGTVLAAWSSYLAAAQAEDPGARERWDILAATLDEGGNRQGAAYRLNEHAVGDQFLPKVTALEDGFQVVWTSLAQDGAREGVFGRAANRQGPSGTEKQLNSIIESQQIHPAVGSADGTSALVVWSTFAGGPSSFDLVAQRLSSAPSLAAPQKPFVRAASSSRLAVTWPLLEGMDVAAYELYVDGSDTAIEVASNRYYLEKLAPGSQHTFELVYRLSDGQRSPASEQTAGVTWGEDDNFDGLPDDWQTTHWGESATAWEGGSADSDNDGASNLQELLAGTDPTDSGSVLKTHLASSPQGTRLVWNTEPGCIYQVQVTEDLQDWGALGGERFAAETSDSLLIQGSSNLVMYRVIRIR